MFSIVHLSVCPFALYLRIIQHLLILAFNETVVKNCKLSVEIKLQLVLHAELWPTISGNVLYVSVRTNIHLQIIAGRSGITDVVHVL